MLEWVSNLLLDLLVCVGPHFFQNRLLLSLEELLRVGQVEEVDLRKRSFKVRWMNFLSGPKWGFRVKLANFWAVRLYKDG